VAKLTTSSKKLEKVFELLGFSTDRQKGSHIIMTRPNTNRPIVFPSDKKEVKVGTIKSNLRTAGIDNDEYFKLLKKI